MAQIHVHSMFMVFCSEMEEAGIIGFEADGREALLAEETGWERKTAKEQIKELKDTKREGRIMVIEVDNREKGQRETFRSMKMRSVEKEHCGTVTASVLSITSGRIQEFLFSMLLVIKYCIITYTLKFLESHAVHSTINPLQQFTFGDEFFFLTVVKFFSEFAPIELWKVWFHDAALTIKWRSNTDLERTGDGVNHAFL